MISESTYGDKLHSNRDIEEERLIVTVKEAIDRRGKILIPAFALGRVQEIILILRRAINKKELPDFPIYIDGMIRAINRIYKLNPNYLQSNLARKIFRGNDIFYDDNVPANGESYSFSFRNPRKQLDYNKAVDTLNSSELDEDNIERFWEHIYSKSGTNIGYFVEEIIYIQEGIEDISSVRKRKESSGEKKIRGNRKYWLSDRGLLKKSLSRKRMILR